MQALKEIEKLEHRSQQSGEAYLILKKEDIKICSLRIRQKVKYFYFRRSISGDYIEISRDQMIELIQQQYDLRPTL